MTVIAVGNFEGFNIILSDAVGLTAETLKDKNSYRLTRKIIKDTYENIFYSIMGDETILLALDYVWEWSRLKKYKFNTFKSEDIEKLLSCVKYVRRAYENNMNLLNPQNSCLFVMDINKIMVWDLVYNNVSKEYVVKPDSPKIVEINSLEIYYFNTDFKYEIKLTEKNVRDWLINKIKEIDSERRLKTNFPYELNDKYYSVIIPKDGREFIEEPFYEYFSEFVYGFHGGVENLKLVETEKWSPF